MGAGAKVKDRVALEVEDDGLGRHEAEHDAEVGRVGTPGNVVDWTLFGCLDTRTHINRGGGGGDLGDHEGGDAGTDGGDGVDDRGNK